MIRRNLIKIIYFSLAFFFTMGVFDFLPNLVSSVYAESKQKEIIWTDSGEKPATKETQNVAAEKPSGESSGTYFEGEKPTDKVRPKITGAKSRTVVVDSKINFKKGIKATDNVDGNITKKVKINSKHVNLRKTGKYPVWYAVTDKAGNKTVKKVYITVKAKKIAVEKETDKIIDGGVWGGGDSSGGYGDTQNIATEKPSGESSSGYLE